MSKARQEVQRGADVLLHRDSSRIPETFDDSYKAGEGALRALCDQIECFEQETRLVGGQKDVFARLKADAIKATRAWYQTKERPDAGKGGRSNTNWAPFICQNCERLLLKHVGVGDVRDAGLEVVCYRCKATNYLFGAGEGATLSIDAGSMASIKTMANIYGRVKPKFNHNRKATTR